MLVEGSFGGTRLNKESGVGGWMDGWMDGGLVWCVVPMVGRSVW